MTVETKQSVIKGETGIMRNASCKSALAKNAPFPNFTSCSTQWSRTLKTTGANSGSMCGLTELVWGNSCHE